jgi:serine/threonine-protein kinase
MSDAMERLNAALEGRYRLDEEIGEGGMATVYLAEDLKHHRPVALKVLKPELAAVVGADRFLTEIETTAGLQHPHILPLHDSGEADHFLYYVMPYVEGESLRDRLDRERQLPVDEAVGIAVSLAGALEHAHRKGIVHRDIKPANILMQDGQPIIADFGIALAVGSAGGARLTETGLSVGTPYYMSPEQATGDQQIGARSDIYALACVLYEMLTGEPPFGGSTAQAVLGRILSGDSTPVTQVRPSIPAHVDGALRKGLEKIPADRFASAEEFGKALSDRGFRYGQEADDRALAGRAAGPWRGIAIASGIAALVLGAIAVWGLTNAAPDLPVTRYAVMLPDDHDPAAPYGANLAISPDGSTLVYVGPGPDGTGTQLWLRRLDQLDPTPIGGTSTAFAPVFSPDGTRVAFLAGPPNTIRIVSLTGEPPLTVADSLVGGNSLDWGDDGYLYADLASTVGIGRVPVGGGTLESLTVLDTATAEGFHAWQQALPGGRGLIGTIGYIPVGNMNEYRIAAFDLESGETRVLVPGVYARYVSTGHLVYVSPEGVLLQAPFDVDRLEVTGPSTALVEGVGIGAFGSADITVGADGTLAYMAGSAASSLARVVRVNREGEVVPVDPDWQFDPGLPEVALRLSPDDRRLAVKISTEAGEDIWVKELPDGPLSRLTFDDNIDRRPNWTADGRSVYYTSDRGSGSPNIYDLWIQPADGTGSPEVLLDLEGSILEAGLTPDEQTFALRLGGLSGQTGVRDLVGIRRGETETFPVATEPWDEKGLALSPSGRWIAYESTETGQDQVYVRPFPDADGGKWQVSTEGGFNPMWAHDEEELFFIDAAGNMVVATVEAGTTFRVGQRQTLFSVADRQLDGQPNNRSWDMTSDDEYFVMVQPFAADDAERNRLVIVQNFASLLGR